MTESERIATYDYCSYCGLYYVFSSCECNFPGAKVFNILLHSTDGISND